MIDRRRRKTDWAKVLFVDHPQVFLPWMKAQGEQAKADVRGLRIVFEKFRVHDGARILDLACGIGRISINVAKAGYQVVGVDISPLYLDFAKKWAEQERVTDQARFYEMDMRYASRQLRRKGEEKFDVVLNYGTAIGYRGEDADAEMLADIRGIASQHALLVIETVNRDYLVKHFEPRIRVNSRRHRVERFQKFESRKLVYGEYLEILQKEGTISPADLNSSRVAQGILAARAETALE
jgi:SAM-dependent methyltransferase